MLIAGKDVMSAKFSLCINCIGQSVSVMFCGIVALLVELHLDERLALLS